jgi:transcription antitermination factor NusG
MLAPNDDIRWNSLRLLQRRIGGRIRDGKLYPIGPYLSRLEPLDPAINLNRRWHVVQCESQREGVVAAMLWSEHKFDAYWPKVPKKVRIVRDRYRTVERSLLPGYIFAGFDAQLEHWEPISRISGAVRLLMINMRPVPIAQAVIDHIRAKEVDLQLGPKRRLPIELNIGSCVRVTQPLSFSGLFGFITAIDEQRHKVCVELDIFDRKTPVWIEPESMEVV